MGKAIPVCLIFLVCGCVPADQEARLALMQQQIEALGRTIVSLDSVNIAQSATLFSLDFRTRDRPTTGYFDPSIPDDGYRVVVDSFPPKPFLVTSRRGGTPAAGT